MKYLLIFLLFSSYISAQEICNNGLDDDNDGLVDLNDNIDCTCNGINSMNPGNNFIPNPSFEEYSCLPSDFTQLALGSDGIFCVSNWQAGTWGSSDYFINTPGSFWPNIPTPLPNGQAAAGFFIINLPDVPGFDGNIEDGIYLEYLKTCLTQPLQPGNSYNFQLNLNGMGMSSFGNSLTTIWFGPIDITLFGSSNCTQSAIQTDGCPVGSTDWVKLGHATYQADGTWQTLNMPFTALHSIQSIMIGGPCSPLMLMTLMIFLKLKIYQKTRSLSFSTDGGMSFFPLIITKIIGKELTIPVTSWQMGFTPTKLKPKLTMYFMDSYI